MDNSMPTLEIVKDLMNIQSFDFSKDVLEVLCQSNYPSEASKYFIARYMYLLEILENQNFDKASQKEAQELVDKIKKKYATIKQQIQTELEHLQNQIVFIEQNKLTPEQVLDMTVYDFVKYHNINFQVKQGSSKMNIVFGFIYKSDQTSHLYAERHKIFKIFQGVKMCDLNLGHLLNIRCIGDKNIENAKNIMNKYLMKYGLELQGKKQEWEIIKTPNQNQHI